MSHQHHHGGGGSPSAALDAPLFALVGSPNSGKTTLFNALTGLRAKTGNYPGVTVARYSGVTEVEGAKVSVEDLPGVYSLDPISPDEQIVADILVNREKQHTLPDAVITTMDSTNLRRSLNLTAQVLNLDLPTLAVLTFTDELLARQGRIDIPALQRALGVPVVAVTAGEPGGVARLKSLMADPAAWPRPVVPPPTEPGEVEGYVQSVLTASDYVPASADAATRRIDAVLLHPVAGTLVFFAVMFLFFQVLFTVAAPLQDAISTFFGWLGGLAGDHVPGLLGRFLSEALIGGVGAVLAFVPQIALLFVLISLLEGSGYLSRAAFLMDRVMSRFGLEGRAFVALLSSLACAIPGIMATRSLPSARDRLATMMAAPLMTCSARVPVYTMLIALLVPPTRLGPLGLQGLVMFALYVLGAFASMLTAALFSRIAGRGHRALPFYMEIPPYRVPSARSVALSVWESASAFLRKVTSIILLTTAILWGALNLQVPGTPEPATAGVDATNTVAVRQYTIEHSLAGSVGKAMEPVFAAQGFDWRINIGVVASLSAREVFVATMGQIAAAENPDDPVSALEQMTVTDGPREGQRLFVPATVAALLVFFMFALQCFSTIAVMRRETGGWRWPATAFGYLLAVAWTMSALAHAVVGAFT